MSNHLSGEEGEEIIYSDNVELFRFDAVSKTWKERCCGELKMLKNSQLMKFRILMRRDVTSKVCANHFITVDMKVLSITENAVIWNACDFSEEILKIEIFAARFKTLQKAQNFHIAFENVLTHVKGCNVVVDYKNPVLSTPSKPWICEVCKVINNPDISICSNCSPPVSSTIEVNHINVISSPINASFSTPQKSLQKESSIFLFGSQILEKGCESNELKGNIADSSIKVSIKTPVKKYHKSNQLKLKNQRKSPRKSQMNEDPVIWDLNSLLEGSQIIEVPLSENSVNENSLNLHEASFKLVKILSECNQFSISFATLKKEHKYELSEIKQIVNKYNSTFELNDSILSLKPKISLCKAHSESLFCLNKDKCPDLHICPKYIQKLCNSKKCVLGHSWETNHNQHILRAYLVDSLQEQSLNNLFISMSLNESITANKLQICMNYNTKTCFNLSCNDLHFCLAYLANHCVSSQDDCRLCHSTSNKVVASVLSCYGVSVNESPKDVMHTIASCPLVKQCIDKFINDRSYPKVGLHPCNSTEQFSESRVDMNFGSHEPDFNLHCGRLKDLKSVTKTVWSHYYMGDVEIAEICNNSVQGYCVFEDSGCKRMHSHRYFHWQVRGKGKSWVNLPDYQVLAIEKSFCDPEIDVFDIPLLNPSKLDHGTMGLVTTLKGRSQWEANFQTMQLIMVNRNVFEKSTCLELRRLSVPFCTYMWYFLDQSKNWIEYGVTDSKGKNSQVNNINSLVIENHFITKPNSPLYFQNSSFAYVLDVLNLAQTNLHTNNSRDVKRRPKLDLNIGLSDESITIDDLPVHWEPMDASERSRKVTLLATSPEYQKVQALLTQKRENFNIVRIERIQNMFLYRAFQNKVHEMTSTLKSKRAVNVQTLFHGTKSDNILAICEENFDWRLYGNNVGHKYGKGTYFSPSPKMALQYSDLDFLGYRFMFVAQVAVGSQVLGESSMSRPPINPNTNLPYDSTVNSISSPSVVVKFDKQEYYPEYLITVRS